MSAQGQRRPSSQFLNQFLQSLVSRVNQRFGDRLTRLVPHEQHEWCPFVDVFVAGSISSLSIRSNAGRVRCGNVKTTIVRARERRLCSIEQYRSRAGSSRSPESFGPRAPTHWHRTRLRHGAAHRSPRRRRCRKPNFRDVGYLSCFEQARVELRC
jgi:hypothetical protein